MLLKIISLFLLPTTILFASELKWETHLYIKFKDNDKIYNSYLKLEKATTKENKSLYRFSQCMENITKCLPLGKQKGFTAEKIFPDLIPNDSDLIKSQYQYLELIKDIEESRDLLGPLDNKLSNVELNLLPFYNAPLGSIPGGIIGALITYGLYLLAPHKQKISSGELFLLRSVLSLIGGAATSFGTAFYDMLVISDEAESLWSTIRKLKDKIKKLKYYYLPENQTVYFQKHDMSLYLQLIKSL